MFKILNMYVNEKLQLLNIVVMESMIKIILMKFKGRGIVHKNHMQ